MPGFSEYRKGWAPSSAHPLRYKGKRVASSGGRFMVAPPAGWHLGEFVPLDHPVMPVDHKEAGRKGFGREVEW